MQDMFTEKVKAINHLITYYEKFKWTLTSSDIVNKNDTVYATKIDNLYDVIVGYHDMGYGDYFCYLIIKQGPTMYICQSDDGGVYSDIDLLFDHISNICQPSDESEEENFFYKF